MEAPAVSETSEVHSTLTRLITREDSIAHCIQWRWKLQILRGNNSLLCVADLIYTSTP